MLPHFRGSGFSSIRSSCRLPSDEFAANDLPPSHHGSSDATPSINSSNKKPNATHPSPQKQSDCLYASKEYDLNKHFDYVYTAPKLKNRLDKSRDESPPSNMSVDKKSTDTPIPRANRSLLDIAASKPPSYDIKNFLARLSHIRSDDEDTDDDVDETTKIDTPWNDIQRQATIITIPSRKDTMEEQPTSDKPKKKRRWENVSPPSSPTKKNYEMSLATIAAPPNKRKPTGSDVPRPHACHLCDRRFNRRYNLAAHIRVHDPDRKKLFDCPSCNQSFDRKHDRDRHADALHFEHKHRCYCHLCDASFTRRDALTRHVHKLHTQASPSNP